MQGDDTIKSPDTMRQERVPPGQRLTNDWPVLHAGDVPIPDTSRWTFSISGLVETEQVLSFAQFMELPRVKVFSDIHCVTGWSRLNNLWEGVSAATVTSVAKPKAEARFVLIHAEAGFTTNLRLEDFLQADVLFAVKHNEKPLTPPHGYPVRLVVPRLYFWKSAKWARGVEFLAHDRRGFWESRGYHNHGDPWQEERYS